MPNHSMQDFRVKRTAVSSIKGSKIHWGSFLPTIITVLGVGAWIAGEAFYMGYWSAAGIPAITSMSLQQTAFAGFAAAYYNWAWLPLVIGLCALYFAILAVDFKSRGTLKIQWLTKLKNWWSENIEIDKKLGKLVSSLLIAAILFFILILAPLTVWVVKAMGQGKEAFQRQACSIRAAKTLPSAVTLADGTTIGGKVLDRSEKALVFLNRTTIYVITVDGEKNKLLDSTDIQHVKCL